jgi:uncharacterized protein YjiS (DUF1127 family)
VHSTNSGVGILGAETTPLVLRAVGAFAEQFKRYLTYRQRLADRAVLTSFSDRELGDIGINRCDLDRILNGGGR